MTVRATPGSHYWIMRGLLHSAVVALDCIFFLGLVGSAIVILLTTIEDVKVLFEKEKIPERPE